MSDTPKNTIEFKVCGKYALFTDPITKLGGEKCSYQIPTYEAIKGIIKSIYWKPTFIWIVDEVRVMKSIEMESKGIRTIKYYDGKAGLYFYTYLKNVEYQVRAHFEWNCFKNELKEDRNDGKHFAIANRSIERGGRQDIFLGTRECQGYVERCEFNTGQGFYDRHRVSELSFGMMFHSFGYPNEIGEDKLEARLWNAKMNKGIINFKEIKEKDIKRYVKSMKRTDYVIDKDILSVDKEYKNMFINERGTL
ncbi:MAG: type I-C CRISPR-associated protein Cas5c [Endomicrobium sp.]|jgi:CRISPR-associated protein Cas5d|nr:type I-C CRISPR-associated protein Cas5c [Endomicrobium sp.]